MKPRTLLVLFVVVAGLLAFIWFVERDLPSTDERREAAKKILDVEPEKVREITIERGAQVVRLVRQGSEAPQDETADDAGGEEPAGELTAARDWRLVEPYDARADSAAVTRLLDTLEDLERQRTLEEFDAAAVGLVEPRARIRWVADAGEQALRIGSDVPASSHLIVQREGSTEAAVARRDVWSAIDKEPGAWRSRQVFTGSSIDVTDVRMVTGDRTLNLARRAGDFWIEDPVDDRARGGVVDELLSTLLGLEVERFLDDPPAATELGLEPPAAVIEITLRSGAGPGQRLELGAPVPGSAAGETAGEPEAEDGGEPGLRYARFEGHVVELADELAEALERGLEQWQDDRWSAFDVWQVDRAVLRTPGDETVFARDGGEWRRGDVEIAYGPVSDLLYAIDEAASEELLPVDPAAWGDPLLEVDLSGDEGSESLALYPAIDGRHPASASGRDFAVLLAPDSVEELLAKLETARNAEPEAPPESSQASD